MTLLVIVSLAAFLRLFHFGQSPPGLNQDEAVNAWNAWCLLKTGTDMTGTPWPVFYSHSIGDNRTTLFFYALLPFQALGGLGVVTTRLPSAVSGIACIPLVYYVGARMFGPLVGLAAAALMALEPWPLFMSRWGIEGGLCPALALAVLALTLRAGFPLTDAPDRPRPATSLLAGLAAGIACYGYWPMRLHIPALIVMILLATGRDVWRWVRTGAGRLAAGLFAAGLAATAGPLLWRHLTDPGIARRAEMTRLWDAGTPVPEILRRVGERYLAHFSPDFLFVRGDLFDIVKPIGQGEFNWYLMPCMVAGAGLAITQARRRRVVRVLLALVLAYPAGDIISRYASVHALRSSPGIGALVLLGAWGGVEGLRWLWRRHPITGRWVATSMLVLVAALNARYLVRYFGEYNRRPEIYHGYQADLLEASEWLRPRLNEVDAVLWTTTGLNQPFAITLVGLRYEPRRWFSEPRDRRSAEWDLYVRYGKQTFMYGDLWRPHLEGIVGNGRADRVLFIVRPGELGLDQPLHTINGPNGQAVLWIVGKEL